MVEFTGERIVPGCVDDDLLQEHQSRYHFAASLASRKRCLDAGCGLGYGAAILAETAASVCAVDVDPITVSEASTRYHRPNARFTLADVTGLPFRNSTFECVVSFEVVEHLPGWPHFLRELARVTTSDGIVMISTPNRDYYAASRGESGPNPFHVHEFDYQEFHDALLQVFPHVRIFGQNAVPGICFFSHEASSPFTVHSQQSDARVPDAQFYLAVCSQSPLPSIPGFAYLSSTGNVLRERARHIALLKDEIQTKTKWLEESTASLAALQSAHTALEDEFRTRSEWAITQIASLEARNQELASSLDSKCAELETAVHRLHEAEESVLERTQWAKELDAHNLVLRERIAQLEHKLAATQSSLQEAQQQVLTLQTALDNTESLRHQEIRSLAEVFGIDTEQEEPTIPSIVRTAGEALQRSEERLRCLETIRRSRWTRLGRSFGLGPDLSQLP